MNLVLGRTRTPTDNSVEVLLRASVVTIRMLSVCLCVDPRDNVSSGLDHRNWVSHRLIPGETPSLDCGCTVSDEVAESNEIGVSSRGVCLHCVKIMIPDRVALRR